MSAELHFEQKNCSFYGSWRIRNPFPIPDKQHFDQPPVLKTWESQIPVTESCALETLGVAAAGLA